MTTTPLEGVLPCLRRMFAAKGNDNVADAELVRRFAQQRDEAAFELLVWRHGRMVLHVCRRILGHEQEAEDAFQATFLTLARRAGARVGLPSRRDWITAGPGPRTAARTPDTPGDHAVSGLARGRPGRPRAGHIHESGLDRPHRARRLALCRRRQYRRRAHFRSGVVHDRRDITYHVTFESETACPGRTGAWHGRRRGRSLRPIGPGL